MPLRRQLKAGGDESEGTAADETPQGTDVTTQAIEEPAEPAPTKPRRRWFSLRRRAKEAEPEGVSGTDEVAETEESTPAPRRPVGKARRTAAVQTAVEAPAEDDAETPATQTPEPEAH